ncbi:MAG: 50S ribosomal protein L3 [Patescibacteria group bacterium]
MRVLLGRKLNMTRIFEEDGTVVPVTVVDVSGCAVTQVRDHPNHTIEVQLGYGKVRHLTKPLQGHLKDLPPFRFLRSFQHPPEEAKDFIRGKEIPATIFQPGESVSVTGSSKGKGFAGVIKRHHFHGHPSTHGHKDSLRAPGSIGAGGVQRVMKGRRMAGRMGGERVTVKNLTVVKVEPERGLLYVSGAVPGARNSLVVIKSK